MDEQIDRIGRPNVMRGFLGPEVFEGGVTIVRKPRAAVEQLRLVSD